MGNFGHRSGGSSYGNGNHPSFKGRKKKFNGVNMVVYQGRRLMFTDDEINNAWERANKHSGLGVS